ncbi:VOC family protein [Streptomyces sp. NPDC006207]
MTQPEGTELQRLVGRREQLKQTHVRPMKERTTTARGVHHAAFICRDLEETILFYTEVLGFPLVELVENPSYPGSSHFFFDLGNRNLLGFFDFPGHPHPGYEEALGGIHHFAVSFTPEELSAVRQRMDDRGTAYKVMQLGVRPSLHLADPNGLRLELSQSVPGFIGRTEVVLDS